MQEIVTGKAVFSAEMPVWGGKYGEDVWPSLNSDDPLYTGATAGAIVWSDYINGRGSTFGHPNSLNRASYPCCLTQEIVADLKVAAVIHGYFPTLVKNSRSTRRQLDPKTVKGRIDELARIFSMVIVTARDKYKLLINSLRDISFPLLKEVISDYPGRGAHLKRALKLISSPVIQKNISAPLQWQLVDIEKSNIAWPATVNGEGILPLPDPYFLFIQDYCIKAIANFKSAMGLSIHCSECRQSGRKEQADLIGYNDAVRAFLEEAPKGRVERAEFGHRFSITAEEVEDFIVDAQCASLMLFLLFTGMRRTETMFVLVDSLSYEQGYWFVKSKVVKHRRKDEPICEGWLAIDVVRDAHEILSLFCGFTKNRHLFSTPFRRFSKEVRGYSLSTITTKLSRWLKRIDVEGLYSDWIFSIHQCRETLVSQLADQEVKLPFISMQLKHFHSRFHGMPNEVTAGYGKYRAQLMTSVSTRLAQSRESALKDLYDEKAKFAGGGASAHKSRVDAFFAGMGLFGADRDEYIKSMARRGVKLQPTSIGICAKNFELPTEDAAPPCYGDYECDPDCGSHVITARGGQALVARREHALAQAHNEENPEYKVIWLGLAEKLGRHTEKLGVGGHDGV